METIILFKGITLSFILAMPVGPIALLCISNTLGRGPRFGLATGLGAATADGIYGLIAAFGIGVLVNFMSDYSVWLKLMGSGFLVYLGWKIMTSPIRKGHAEVKTSELLKTYLAVLGLTLINPMTIAIYMGAFAGMGAGSTEGNLYLSLILGLGTLLGSTAWHFLLVLTSNLLKTKIKDHHLRWLNKGSGALLGLFGVISLGSVLI